MTSGKSNTKFMQEIRRGDKEIDEIKIEIEFCNMNPELKSKCIEKTRDAMKTTLENNFSYFLKNDLRFLLIDVEEKKKELLSMLAPYNPIVHVNDGNDNDGDWCFLFDEEEFAIEIKNPKAKTKETRLFIVFDDSVNNEFTLYFAGWHKYYRMINYEYD